MQYVLIWANIKTHTGNIIIGTFDNSVCGRGTSLASAVLGRIFGGLLSSLSADV